MTTASSSMKNEVFVTNMMPGTTAEVLGRIFASSGEVQNVRLASDGSYAFVAFATSESVQGALGAQIPSGLRVLPATPETLTQYHLTLAEEEKTQAAAIIDALPIDDVRAIIDAATSKGSEALARLLEDNPGLAEALISAFLRCQQENAIVKTEPASNTPKPDLPPELIAQALQLTEEQLSRLQPDRRAKIERLRAQYASSQPTLL